MAGQLGRREARRRAQRVATYLSALFARRERHGIGDMQQNLLETRVFRIKVLHEAPLRL